MILIADDHPLFREALRYIVDSVLPGVEVHEASNYQESKAQLAQHSYLLVFIDLNMPDSNGLTDLALIKKMYPHIPMVVVSAYEEPDIVQSCLDYNASGYIVKSSSPDEIKAAINTILQGDIYVPKAVQLEAQSQQAQNKDSTEKINSLTPSQLNILIEIGKGKLNKQIAYDLGITEATVKAHITTIFKKLNINNRTQAMLFTQQHHSKINSPK